ncbi:hypothetical protein K438DRAFT_1955817 [Mycena galopus ATCC 62051]|nr:hypothetical protein K438DRAFT_1955817 [Mycena galopus ATCC 62051]
MAAGALRFGRAEFLYGVLRRELLRCRRAYLEPPDFNCCRQGHCLEAPDKLRDVAFETHSATSAIRGGWRGEILCALLKRGFSSFPKTFASPPALRVFNFRGSFPAAVTVAAGGAEAVVIAIVGTGGDRTTTFTAHDARLLTQSAAVPLCVLPSAISTATECEEITPGGSIC